MAGDLYPHATHIVDGYHAREHLHDLASHLAFITPDATQWLADRSAELDAGNIGAIIAAARSCPLEGVKADELDTKIGYFEHNIHRMRYARFRKLGMFAGSGHIEAACKQIVAQRAKQSGMHWSLEDAASIIALRCHNASGRWNDFIAPPCPISRIPGGRLTDSKTQTPRQQHRARSSPTNLSCSPLLSTSLKSSDATDTVAAVGAYLAR